jgi:chemotaxis protein methyltransferase CheR
MHIAPIAPPQIDMPFVAAFIKREAGIILDPGKSYFVQSRLGALARQHGKDSVGALIDELRMRPSTQMRTAVTEALTTNETSFFRDGTPFRTLRETLLPQLTEARAKTRTLRFWCAAASTGQEPYSLAMLLAETDLRARGWKIEITATDLDSTVLDRARAGIYSGFEVQRGLPASHLVKYFVSGGRDSWQIRPDIRAMVTFRQTNLLSLSSIQGTFDVIFCRNVLIYFDLPTKQAVLGSLEQRLAPDGALFLGGAESVFGITHLFAPDPAARGAYRKTK